MRALIDISSPSWSLSLVNKSNHCQAACRRFIDLVSMMTTATNLLTAEYDKF